MIINLTNEPFNDDQKIMFSLFVVRCSVFDIEENANVTIVYVSIKDSFQTIQFELSFPSNQSVWLKLCVYSNVMNVNCE